MAEVVNSLFGITPESLMAEREKALQTQAMQYAQADPFQRATAAIYSGANRLGGAVGGLLGAQDPEMMRIQQRQGVLQNLDLTNPESLKQGIQAAMQNKDYQLVSELTNRYQQRTAAELAARKTEAEITAKTAEKKSFSVGDKAFLALAAKATPASVKAAQDAGNDISLLDVPEAEKVSTYGQVLKDAGLTPGTPEFQKQMQAFAAAELEGTKQGKGAKITNVLPGVGKAGDVTGLRKDLQAITKPYQDQSDAAQDAIELADMALKSNNFAAVSSLSRSLAKAAGETQLSRADVEAFGIDPSLVGRVSDTISTLTQGRPTADTLTKLRQLSEALKKKADSRISVEEQQLQDTARVSGLFTEPQINTVFRRRPSSAPAKTAFTSVKEAEAANLPKGTIITINGRRAVVE